MGDEGAILMRVLVTGSRTWLNRQAVWRALDSVGYEYSGQELVVVHGDAPRGADHHAAEWVARRRQAGARVTEEAHPGDWLRWGNAAGFRRNQEMVDLGADLCLTFIAQCATPSCLRRDPHGTHGAVHCATAAGRAHIKVRHIQLATRERAS